MTRTSKSDAPKEQAAPFGESPADAPAGMEPGTLVVVTMDECGGVSFAVVHRWYNHVDGVLEEIVDTPLWCQLNDGKSWPHYCVFTPTQWRQSEAKKRAREQYLVTHRSADDGRSRGLPWLPDLLRPHCPICWDNGAAAHHVPGPSVGCFCEAGQKQYPCKHCDGSGVLQTGNSEWGPSRLAFCVNCCRGPLVSASVSESGVQQILNCSSLQQARVLAHELMRAKAEQRNREVTP